MATAGSLGALQRRLFDRIAAGEGAGGRAGRAAEALVVGDGRASARARLDVYARMYRFRLVDALAALHPQVAEALGDEFAAMAEAYLARHPSRDPSLRRVGADLIGYLARSRWRRHPGLVELARLDAARLDVFDAPDEQTLTPADLAAVAPAALPDLPLLLVKAHRLLRPRRRGGGAATVLVWRQGVAPLHRALDPVEAAALERLAGGASLGALCEHLCRALGEDQAGPAALRLLAQWTSDELLVRPRG